MASRSDTPSYWAEILETCTSLTPTDYSFDQAHYNEHRHPGTCRWLVDSDAYQTWLGNAQGSLLCHGIPGAGKTIATSMVVDDLESRFRDDPDVAVVFIYFDSLRHSEQNTSNLLLCLIKQMVKKRAMFPEQESDPDLYIKLKYHHSGAPEAEVVVHDFRQIIALWPRVFIVVDALDEVGEAPRAAFLKEMLYVQGVCGVNLFVTSGPDMLQEVSVRLGSRVVALEVRPDEQDLKRYIAEGLSGGDNRYPRADILSIVSRAATSRCVGLPCCPVLKAVCTVLWYSYVAANEIESQFPDSQTVSRLAHTDRVPRSSLLRAHSAAGT